MLWEGGSKWGLGEEIQRGLASADMVKLASVV